MNVKLELYILLGCLVLTGCGRSPDWEIAQQFQQAEDAFANAKQPDDYLRVASMYQAILDTGFTSGIVLYNQGNAFMRAGQRGRAVAAYRQAQRYLPGDAALDANLALALNGASVRQETALTKYVLFWQNWIGYPGKFRWMIAAALLSFGLGVARLYRVRPWLTPAAGCCLMATLLFALSAGYDWYRFDSIERGVIIHDDTVARKGNSESYEAAFTQSLSEGTEFIVAEHRGDWVEIVLPGDKRGWVQQGQVVVY